MLTSRRSFLAALAALPVVGRFFPEPKPVLASSGTGVTIQHLYRGPLGGHQALIARRVGNGPWEPVAGSFQRSYPILPAIRAPRPLPE